MTFSGRRARQSAQDVSYITERCVIRLMPEGLTVTEVAPGVDLQRDVLAQAGVPLAGSPRLVTMDPRLFVDAPMQLALPRRPSRIAAAAERSRA